MPQPKLLDLPAFGLHFVPFGDPRFAELHASIIQPASFPAPGASEIENGAILLNESGKAVVALQFLWRLEDTEGRPVTRRIQNLNSSVQLEFLLGRRSAVRELDTSILPGSKRLITRQGLYGTNWDIRPPADGRLHGGAVFGFSESSGRGLSAETAELSLDFVIFDDGLCVGPDTGAMFDELRESLGLMRTAAADAVRALRAGESEGRVFDLLMPLIRQERHAVFLHMFAEMAIHQLTHATREALHEWFAAYAEPPEVLLQRA